MPKVTQEDSEADWLFSEGLVPQAHAPLLQSQHWSWELGELFQWKRGRCEGLGVDSSSGKEDRGSGRTPDGFTPEGLQGPQYQ